MTKTEADVAPDPEPAPEPTSQRVQAPLAIAGLFARNEIRVVELTPFTRALIASGKLVPRP
jgi:hypothetical protein